MREYQVGKGRSHGEPANDDGQGRFVRHSRQQPEVRMNLRELGKLRRNSIESAVGTALGWTFFYFNLVLVGGWQAAVMLFCAIMMTIVLIGRLIEFGIDYWIFTHANAEET